MSNLNDLIHTNAYNAFGIGVKTERDRILKVLEDDYWHNLIPVKQTVLPTGTYEGFTYTHSEDCPGCRIIQQVKGEQK